MTETLSANQGLTISERGARQIAKLLAREAQGTMLRVTVSGGGCSGFQYAFAFDDSKTEDDLSLQPRRRDCDHRHHLAGISARLGNRLCRRSDRRGVPHP